MKLVHKKIDHKIDIKENIVNLLIIENKKFFREIASEILGQIDGLEGGFLLFDDIMELEINKNIVAISDVLRIDINNKSNVLKLQKDIEGIAMGEEFYLDSMAIQSQITTFLENIAVANHISPIYGHKITVSDLVKLAKVEYESNNSELLESVINYITIIARYGGIKLIVLFNLHMYFDNQEIEEIYKCSFYEKIGLLLIESIDVDNMLREHENKLIIDNDLCEI
ncbi:MAG: type II-A CRISPR-associated protein Csn2 [Anaerovoracaceae bacterium]